MKLGALAYELPLVRPLRLGAVELAARRGWLLRQSQADGSIGWADVAPLPSFSVETEAQVKRGLQVGDSGGLASVSWAAHTLSWGALVEPVAVRSAGLWVDEAERGSVHTVKIKVGRRPLAEELALIEQAAANGARLRLDGNRSLSIEGTLRLAAAAGPALEFLEEPLATSAELLEVLPQVPIALDETLVETDIPPAGAVAWVIKPTVLGAPRVERLVALARQRNVDLVVSSAFESAVGRRALVRFAHRVAPDRVHGLGTGPWFATDFAGCVGTDGDRVIAMPDPLSLDLTLRESRPGHASGEWQTIEVAEAQ